MQTVAVIFDSDYNQGNVLHLKSQYLDKKFVTTIDKERKCYILMTLVHGKMHCKLATLSPGKKPMLPGRRYFLMSPAGRQRLQFYNEFIKW